MIPGWLARRFSGLVTFGFLLVFTVLGGLLWLQWTLQQPGPLTRAQDFVIQPGTGVGEIAQKLEAAGVIADAFLFVWGTRLTGADGRLQAGEYRFPPAVSPKGVIDRLVGGQTHARRLTVPEGYASGQIYALLAATEGLTGDVPAAPTVAGLSAAKEQEGRFLPETYHFSRDMARRTLLARMRQAMEKNLDTLWADRTPNPHITTPRQAVILASIVEKETGVGQERAKVAGVFLNRLELGMRLQSDPTVIYGLAPDGKGLGRRLRRGDLQRYHPYNTYQIDGLPPGPICNPGRKALEAVLHPAETDALYFVADGSGGHAFARTLKEHNRNVARWRRLRDGK